MCNWSSDFSLKLQGKCGTFAEEMCRTDDVLYPRIHDPDEQCSVITASVRVRLMSWEDRQRIVLHTRSPHFATVIEGRDLVRVENMLTRCFLGRNFCSWNSSLSGSPSVFWMDARAATRISLPGPLSVQLVSGWGPARHWYPSRP